MILRYNNSEIEYTVSVKAIKSEVLEVDGRGIPVNTSGFTLFNDDHSQSFDYSQYRTLYREVEGGLQYSNDGSIYVEPDKTVYAGVSFIDTDQSRRPESVTCTVYDNDTLIEEVSFSDETGWSKPYTIKQSHSLNIECDDEFEGYDKTINGSYVTFTEEVPYEPSVEEQLQDIMDAVIDLDDRVSALEG